MKKKNLIAYSYECMLMTNIPENIILVTDQF